MRVEEPSSDLLRWNYEYYWSSWADRNWMIRSYFERGTARTIC